MTTAAHSTGPGPDPADVLAASAMAGDREALRELWERNRAWVAAILIAHKPRWASVDDLLQDVATTLVRKVRDIRDPGALRPWLRTVAINAARLEARDGDERGVGGAGHEGTSEASLDPGPGTADREWAAKVMDMALRLPEGYREPLLLKAINGMSYKQIGVLMGLPDTTVETRIARGRRMLREMAGAAAATA